jgi:dGTP triphosphohydrolase
MNANSSDLETHLDAMREEISESLEKAEAQRNALKRKNSRYMTTNIILSALAALLAGIAGTIGNAQNWKITCLFSAACSAGVTVTTKLQTTEQLTEASECVGQLKALQVETVIPTYDLEQVSEKYQQILSDFSALDL